jgi:rhodanese-related sulfurtransferase
LEEAELAYAPQFGSAKDPINMAGFVAAGVVRGDSRVAHTVDLAEAAIVDVRTREEFEGGHIPGAVNFPIDELRERLGELDRNQRTITYCQFGQRGYLATRILAQASFDVANLSGGYLTYCQTTSDQGGAAAIRAGRKSPPGLSVEWLRHQTHH